ncbi:hypothetical protein ACFV2L_35670 [Streptomyces sp. NPDC059687]|uniref:hypothetical protein n=1 Tax=Streptomyces sp. NPDC059687 TaxID=3346905 RepID=UPI0036A333BC
MTPIESARVTLPRLKGPDPSTAEEARPSDHWHSTTPPATAQALPVFTRAQRMLIGVVVSGAVIIAGIGFAGWLGPV